MWRNINTILRRTYFTDGYKLAAEWERRLSTPILQKVNSEMLYVDLSSKFQQKKKLNAIDVDIYVNKADDKHLDEAIDLVQKLRATEQASKMLDSTQHAIVRLLLANNSDLLLSVCNNRLDFGIIPDAYSINLILNKYLVDKNYTAAARMATLQALQEDFEHPVTRFMSAFACYKFLDDIQVFPDLLPPPVATAEETQAPAKSSKKKVEEKKVRVAFLRNSYFDDHFDITNTNCLVGKTFLYLADEVRATDATLANSFTLLGCALYEKYEKGNEFLESAQKSEFYQEVVAKVKSFGEKAGEGLDEHGKRFYDSLNSIASQKEANVATLIEGHLKQAVKENEAKDIDAQRKAFEEFIETRQRLLDDELARMKRIQRLEDIEKIQEDMERAEKKLWFFENYENIKLEIEGKKRYYPKMWFGKKSKPKKLDVDYVPPDVESITRSRLAK